MKKNLKTIIEGLAIFIIINLIPFIGIRYYELMTKTNAEPVIIGFSIFFGIAIGFALSASYVNDKWR